MVAPKMRRAAAALALALTSLAAIPARAGEARCWVDNGAVLVSASIGDIAGDFILDLSASQSQLHDTTAQSDGLGEATAMDGALSFAGERIPAHLAVANLDPRTLGFPTTIDGLIGADVLAGYVVDLRLSPCRITLRRHAGRFAGERLPMVEIAGVPTVAASVSDGRTAREGRFAIDTGAAGLRLSDAEAHLSRTPKGVDPASRAHPPARLAALGLGGTVVLRPLAGLQSGAPPGLLGGIGTDVWSRYAVQVDLKRGELMLSPPLARRRGW
jgi:hypothetical protein